MTFSYAPELSDSAISFSFKAQIPLSPSSKSPMMTDMGGNSNEQQRQSHPTGSILYYLEQARESEQAENDPVVKTALENAVKAIWAKIVANPNSYVLTRDEFPVFNYFQWRFIGDERATAARKRYWDSVSTGADH
jgi:hypothetical protein